MSIHACFICACESAIVENYLASWLGKEPTTPDVSPITSDLNGT
jgi:hypothetical protein